jgi:hypothetical protein
VYKNIHFYIQIYVYTLQRVLMLDGPTHDQSRRGDGGRGGGAGDGGEVIRTGAFFESHNKGFLGRLRVQGP